jgi:putative endonuclease
MPFVYMLHCADGSLYTGIAKDVTRRLAEHRAGRASRYTRARRPVTLAWSRRVRSWRLALREEYRIKQLPRAAKLALVRSGPAPARTAVGRARRGR